MAWWLPLIAAAMNSINEGDDEARARQDGLDDTLNHIRQTHASAAGAQPYAGIASNFATQLSRHDRDHQPAMNAVGAAIQALASDKGKPKIGQGGPDLMPGSYADTEGGGYEVAPERVLGKDPWDPYPEGFY